MIDDWPGARRLEIPPRPDPSAVVVDTRATFYARAAVTRSVRSCTACARRGGCREPVPVAGPLAATWAVLGAVPSVRPSKADRLLWEMMRDAGIRGQKAVWMNRVACPSPVARGGKVGVATAGELAACAGNVYEQLDSAPGVWGVLLVGATALGWIDSALHVSRVHGRVMVKDGRWVVMAVHHPESVLRGRNDAMRGELAEDLRTWRKVMSGEIGAEELVSDRCGECAETVDDWVNGVGLCRRHVGLRGVDGVKVRRRTRKGGLQDEQLFG